MDGQTTNEYLFENVSFLFFFLKNRQKRHYSRLLPSSSAPRHATTVIISLCLAPPSIYFRNHRWIKRGFQRPTKGHHEQDLFPIVVDLDEQSHPPHYHHYYPGETSLHHDYCTKNSIHFGEMVPHHHHHHPIPLFVRVSRSI